MNFRSFFLLTALLACIKAQYAPLCAIASCDGVGPEMGCADVQCYCRPPASTAIVACVQNACDSSDLQIWLKYAEQVCAPYGGAVFSSAAPASSAVTSFYAAASSASSGNSFVTLTRPASTSANGLFGPTPAITSATAGGASRPTAAPVVTQSSSSVNPAVIAGPVSGGVVALAILAFLVWFLRRRNHGQNAQQQATVPSNAPSTNPMSPATDGGVGSGIESAAVTSEVKIPDVSEHEVGLRGRQSEQSDEEEPQLSFGDH